MTKCELLSPAGNAASFIAAAEAGADAIYLGGTGFNARINAGNFTREELKEAFDFARIRGIKTYVTMNTLIRDDEMDEALSAAYDVYDMGADALIIQDLGLGSLIRKYIPGMPIHLSTQGSVYSLDGVRAAERLGYERVVLARELSLDEIKKVCAGTKTEIEVFVHGALCICYSGQCQLSRYFGGRSGNRGQCAQPCRLNYDVVEGFDGNRPEGSHILSPRDFCLIDRVGELIEAGVASLKIEGRMKSPEYVGTVTSIYRKYIDMYYEKGFYTVEEADREALAQIYNRGGFTQGYMDGDPGKGFMSQAVPKNTGVFMGTVAKSSKPAGIITVNEKKDKGTLGGLDFGDRIEIRGEDSVSALITYLRPGGRNALELGDVKGKVRPGDKVYRITSAKQLEEAGKLYKNKTFAEGRYIRRRTLDALVEMPPEGGLAVTLTEPESGISVSARTEEGEKARDLDAASARLEKALRKTGGTPFEIGEISVSGVMDRMIPVSVLNAMRRELLGEMEKALTRERKPEGLPAVAANFEEKRTEAALEVFFYSLEDYKSHREELKGGEVRIRCLLPLAEMIKNGVSVEDGGTDFDIVPYITAISKGPEDEFIGENLDAAIKAAEPHGIYIGNLNWLKTFIDGGVRVYADAGLNAYNRFTEEALQALGVEEVMTSSEVFGRENGNYPLMISEHDFGEGRVRDRKGEILKIRKSPLGGKTVITAENAVSIPEGRAQALSEKRTIRIYI